MPSAVAGPPADQQVLENFGQTLSVEAGKGPRAKRPDRSAARLKLTASKHRGRASAATVRANVKDSAPDLTLSRTIVPPADQVRDVLSDRAVQVAGPDGKGTQVLLSSMPLATASAPSAAGKPVKYTLANLDWKMAGDRFAISRAVQAVSLPKTAGGVARLENGVSFRLADQDSDAPGTVSGETVTYPNIETDTDMVARSLPTGLGVGWSLRSPAAAHELRVQVSVPAGRQLEKDDQDGLIVTGDKDAPATTITPATAIDADGQSVALSTRVEGDSVVYDVDHAEGKVAYPVTVDPLFYSQTFTAGQLADGWFAQNTPNTTQPFQYIYPTGPQPASQLSIYAPPGSYPLGATAAWGRFAPGNPAVGTPQNGPGSRLLSGEHGYWTRFVAGNVVYAVVPTQFYHYYNYPLGPSLPRSGETVLS